LAAPCRMHYIQALITQTGQIAVACYRHHALE
jgi:hypothetical protein